MYNPNLKGHQSPILCSVMDDRRLITGSRDRTVRIWSKRSGQCVHKLMGFAGAVSSMALCGDVLATGCWDGTVALWDLLRWRRIALWAEHGELVTSLVFVGNRLYALCENNSLIFFFFYFLIVLFSYFLIALFSYCFILLFSYFLYYLIFYDSHVSFEQLN